MCLVQAILLRGTSIVVCVCVCACYFLLGQSRAPAEGLAHTLLSSSLGLARTVYVRLARTVYMHRIWLYIWWFPCQKYHILYKYDIYTVYIYGSGQPYVYVHFIWPCVWESPCLNYREYVCMVLANPIHELRLVCTVFGQPCISCAWFAQFLANPA
jgi:hypothetical protein